MPHVRIDGINIYYESHGHGFPIILAYGLGGSTKQWHPQVNPLSQKHRLILWDPRGHGQSDSPTDRSLYSMDNSASDLEGLMDHLSIQRAIIGGLSMGAGIAARFTLNNPNRVAALLIMDSASASGVSFSSETVAMREKTIELALTEGMEAVGQYALKSNPNMESRVSRDPHATSDIINMYKALNPAGYAHSIRALLDADSITDRLQEITAPTLILAGDGDPALEPAKLTHREIKGSKFVVIKDAGHLSNLDQPDIFNSEVSAFLDETEVEI